MSSTPSFPTSLSTSDAALAAVARRRDWLTILLIGSAHATSHFFQLVLPSLFVPLGRAFNLDFADLGLLVSVFYLVSTLGQLSSGFVVDRVGGRPVLWFGLAGLVVSGVLIGAATGYGMLLAAAVVGGIGNCVFHPADYSIINHRIGGARLGHAFSAHGLTGNLGWALTPVFITTISVLADWRAAAFSAAALVAVVLALTVFGRRLLSDHSTAAPYVADAADGARAVDAGRAADAANAAAGRAATHASVWQTLLMLLAKPALWAAFLFFAATSLAGSAVQNYTIPLLGDLYGLSRVSASSALSAYMFTSAVGMLLGGFAAANNPRTELNLAVALVLAGVTLVALSLGWVPQGGALIVLMFAGFCSGVAVPSRDMLVRKVAPKGTTGAVYGLVYSGLDVGSALGPILFGLLLDHGMTHGPWLGAGVAFAAAALLAQLVAVGVRRAAPRPA